MIYGFGKFEWDEELFELRFQGEPVAATPRVLETIGHLIRNRSRAVTKDELLEVIWKGISVGDTALSQTIMLARKALGDEGDRQDVIKTVRGRGFRFVADVTERRTAITQDAVLRSAVAEAPAAAVTGPTLLGREHELDAMWARFEQAEQGRGSLVLVGGEPGIGKTTFAEQCAARARGRGAAVFWARGWDEGGAPGFWLWIQVLRAMELHHGAAVLRELMRPREHDLLPLLSGSAAVDLDAPAVEPLQQGRAHQRFRVLDAMSLLLRRSALHRDAGSERRRTATLIVLEDVHAADEPSIETLRFVVQGVADTPVLILATFRDIEVRPQSPLALLLGGPVENSVRLAMRGLPEAQVARLLESLFKAPVLERQARLICEISGGNPFLVAELVRLCRSPGSDNLVELQSLSAFRMPERVASAVRKRVQELPEKTQELLSLASALGGQFRLGLLSALGRNTEQELLERLDPAIAQGWLVTVGGQISFSHAIVRDTLYGDLPLSRRAELHRSIGELLESDARSDGPPLYDLARHFYLGAAGGSREKAALYALKAAKSAEQMLAFSTAASFYDRAAELAQQDSAGEALLQDRLIAAGHAWYRSGELETAVRRYDSAASLAQSMGDHRRFGWAVFWYMLARSGFVLFDRRLLGLIQEALAALPDSDVALKSMVLAHSALRFNSMGDESSRVSTTAAGVEMARRSGDDFALTIALSAELWQLTGVVAPAKTLAIADELVSVAKRLGNDNMLLNGLQQRMGVHLTRADFPSARRDFTEYATLAEGQRYLAHIYWVEVLRATWAMSSGRFGEAEKLCSQAFGLGERIQEPLAQLIHAAQLTHVYLAQGRGSEIPDAVLAALPADDAYSSRTARMIVSLGRGDAERGYGIFSDLAAEKFENVPVDFNRLWVLASLALVAAGFHDAVRSEQLYRLLAPNADLAIIVPGTLCYLGPVAHYLGLLAAVTGDHERAAEHFDSALVQCDRAAAPVFKAQVQCEYARALLAAPSGNRNRASELLAHAQKAAGELGLSLVAERVRALTAS